MEEALRIAEAAAQTKANRIDVHHHYVPPFREGPSWSWSPEIALGDMDRHNVATAILSGVSFPEPLNDGTRQARDLARRVNEYVATLAEQHPGRFGLFAAVPLAGILLAILTARITVVTALRRML